ncbi:protein transport protein SEC31-like [Amaranthus tricolor]|uniref:protein transport protein SEC31-like n=1 Tax=Amaranthus tricolor TaxID=29722 RepID=UPI0025909675|nr:protein transport protein SEC31-like [Amaranthus tricolor]
MNASKFLDKQIMDLSRSKSTDLNNNNPNDFMDLMNPQSEEESDNGGSSSKNNKDYILPSYDFQPIHRSAASLQLDSPNTTPSPAAAVRSWNSVDSKPNSSPLRSYNSLDHVETDKIILEKAQNLNDSAMLSEIDRTMKTYINSVLHAIDSLGGRLSQLDSRTHHLEHSVDELKVSIGNNHGSADGKMRQLENILLEVQTSVQDLKDKQEVMEGHMQLAKLQISKAEQSSEISNTIHQDKQAAASAPQQSGFQQFSAALQQVPSILPNAPPNVPPPPQQSIHPSHATTQFHPGHVPSGPQQDGYFSLPSQTPELSSQPYQMPPQTQPPQQTPALAPPPQQYPSNPTPSYPQPPQPPQQLQHPAAIGANAPQFSPSLSHRPEEGYIPPQTYPSNLHQPAAQPGSTPPHSQQYYGSPPSMYEPPPASRNTSGPSSVYVPPSGLPGEYTYGGPAPHYGSDSSVKLQPHSPVSSSNYSHLPTAKILPPAIPTASAIGGGSGSGGSGNRVPIDDVIDKVTTMGFPRDHVRATVRRLTENGQSVDLNVVLDKLMNDGEIQPPKGWFGR